MNLLIVSLNGSATDPHILEIISAHLSMISKDEIPSNSASFFTNEARPESHTVIYDFVCLVHDPVTTPDLEETCGKLLASWLPNTSEHYRLTFLAPTQGAYNESCDLIAEFLT